MFYGHDGDVTENCIGPAKGYECRLGEEEGFQGKDVRTAAPEPEATYREHPQDEENAEDPEGSIERGISRLATPGLSSMVQLPRLLFERNEFVWPPALQDQSAQGRGNDDQRKRYGEKMESDEGG